MIAEAVEAAWLVASALAAWIVAGAVVVTVVVLGVVAGVGRAVTALSARLRAARRTSTPEDADDFDTAA